MKNLSLIVFFILFILVLSSFGDEPRNGEFEIITHTAGESQDSVRFWMEAAAEAVWNDDNSEDSLTQRLTSLFDYAHATYEFDYSVKGVPVPISSSRYGIFHSITWSGTPPDDVVYGYGLYKFSIGFEFYNPLIYFYLDWRDCDYTNNYVHNDTWIRFNTGDTICEISWDDRYFNNPDTIDQNEHPTFKLWEYKEKRSGHSGQDTDLFELYLTVTTQNNHPYLSWNAYDVRGGNNDVDYYEIWKKKTGGWFEKDTTSNTYYEDTQEDTSPPGVKKYVYYKIRAIELDEDSSLYGNTVKRPVWDPREEQKIFPFNENFITNNGDNPDKYKLRQNYPNPFNPVTNISFDLPEESSVQLQIYDIQGKLVTTLINETMDKGNYSVSFNSDGLPSGLYFYRLSTKNFTDIKRMLLLK